MKKMSTLLITLRKKVFQFYKGFPLSFDYFLKWDVLDITILLTAIAFILFLMNINKIGI